MNNNTQTHKKLYDFFRKGNLWLNRRNRPELYRDVARLMMELSQKSPNKDILKTMVDLWKIEEYTKIDSNQQLNEHQKKHLQAGVDWIADALKWIIEEELSASFCHVHA